MGQRESFSPEGHFEKTVVKDWGLPGGHGGQSKRNPLDLRSRNPLTLGVMIRSSDLWISASTLEQLEQRLAW